jgi:hypothetical protein
MPDKRPTPSKDLLTLLNPYAVQNRKTRKWLFRVGINKGPQNYKFGGKIDLGERPPLPRPYILESNLFSIGCIIFTRKFFQENDVVLLKLIQRWPGRYAGSAWAMSVPRRSRDFNKNYSRYKAAALVHGQEARNRERAPGFTQPCSLGDTYRPAYAWPHVDRQRLSASFSGIML